MAGMKPIRKPVPAKKLGGAKKGRSQARDAYPIDDEWRAAIRKAMEERGLSQAKLAAEIQAVPSAIVFLFKETTRSSSLVPAIHKALGLVPPVLPIATQAIRAA